MILENVLHQESFFFLEKVEIFENFPAPEGKKNEIFEKVNIFKNLENFHREPKISQKSQLFSKKIMMKNMSCDFKLVRADSGNVRKIIPPPTL